MVENVVTVVPSYLNTVSVPFVTMTCQDISRTSNTLVASGVVSKIPSTYIVVKSFEVMSFSCPDPVPLVIRKIFQAYAFSVIPPPDLTTVRLVESAVAVPVVTAAVVRSEQLYETIWVARFDIAVTFPHAHPEYFWS